MNIIGIVYNDSFFEAETKESKKLTEVRMAEARPPESGLINVKYVQISI
jgi:hypothetical protein